MKIGIENIKINAPVGCYQSERKLGKVFEVSIWLEAPTQPEEVNERLDMTINYEIVLQAVKESFREECRLIETVMVRLKNLIFEKLPHVHSFEVEIRKINPFGNPDDGNAIVKTKFENG